MQRRWKNVLSPTVSRKAWTQEKDFRLMNFVRLMDPKWMLSKDHFPGTTDVIVKNRFCLLKRHLINGKKIQYPYRLGELLHFYEDIQPRQIKIDEVSQSTSEDESKNVSTEKSDFDQAFSKEIDKLLEFLNENDE
jgi:hypothetical protein